MMAAFWIWMALNVAFVCWVAYMQGDRRAARAQNLAHEDVG